MANRVLGTLGWLARQVPTVLVLGGLAALWGWGASRGWKWYPDKQAEDKEKAAVVPLVSLSEEAARLAGVEVEPARQQEVSDVIDAPAVLAFDQTRYAHLAPRAAGTAWRVPRHVGERVKKGDVLALVSAPEVAKAKADFLTAYIQFEVRSKTLERHQRAASSVPERQLREAELALREARVRLINDQQALANLGLAVALDELRALPDDRAAEKVRTLGLPAGLSGADAPGSLLPLTAPFDGLIVRRDIVPGEVVGPSQPAFTVADVRRLWVLLDVRLEDASRLAVGQPVRFRSAAAGQSAAGALTWISAEVDPKTRTVKARAEVDNSDGRLRPGTFGRAAVEVGGRQGVTVPEAALQWDGQFYLVFVRTDATTFAPRLVLPGARSRGQVELRGDSRALLPASLIAAGGGGRMTTLGSALIGVVVLSEVRPGDAVATAGSFVLKSELHKGRIPGED